MPTLSKTLFTSTLVALVSLVSVASVRADGSSWLDTAWTLQSELVLDGKLHCSFDGTRGAAHHQEIGGMYIESLRKGYFQIGFRGGCSQTWFRGAILTFRQEGTALLDQAGNRVGSITRDRLEVTPSSDWILDTRLESLVLQRHAVGLSSIRATFHRKFKESYRVFEFTGMMRTMPEIE